MLSKSQLHLLSHLVDIPESDVAIGTLADSLEWSPGHTSRVVSELSDYGFVQTEPRGREKRVSLTDIEPIEELADLLAEYGHVDFPKLIAGSGMQILYYLDQPCTATELAEKSGVSRATVYRRLKELQQVGIVGKSASRYRLNGSFNALSSISRGLYHQKHRREARQLTSGISIQWETHEEYLFMCDSDIEAERFHLTGPALFEEFGIPLLTKDRRHYFRSNSISKTTPADLVCHTLLINDGPRYRMYCLLLIAERDIGAERLQERAEYYQSGSTLELRSIVDELTTYIEARGLSSSNQLPEWEEFKRTAADYEISL